MSDNNKDITLQSFVCEMCDCDTHNSIGLCDECYDNCVEDIDYDRMIEHVGHNIECVTYGKEKNNVSIECFDCNMVIFSSDK